MATDNGLNLLTRRRLNPADLRIILAALFGVYGLVLVILGAFFDMRTQFTSDDGINVNLWCGIGMLVLTAAFAAWASWRPLVAALDPIAGHLTHPGGEPAAEPTQRDASPSTVDA